MIIFACTSERIFNPICYTGMKSVSVYGSVLFEVNNNIADDQFK